MPIKINYLSLINDQNKELGEIDFFDSYITPSKDFPYFYIGQRNTVLYYSNWVNLVPFLYSQKIKIINNLKVETSSFLVHSFTNASGIATLNFTNANSVAILKGLLEDREAYFLENGTYNDWNKTFTPKANITNGSTTFFTANANYYITNVTVNIVNNTGTIVATAISTTNVSTAYVLTNIEIEFGLFRIPGQSDTQSVYFSGVKGKFICNNNTNLSLNGLKTKSQIIGHIHEHVHNMNNHTHTMPHTHDLSGHTHYMDHQHNYNDYRSDYDGLNFVPNPFTNLSLNREPYDAYKVTSYTRDYTDPPNVNSTGDASQSITSTPSNNTTSGVLSKTTNKDNTNSNENNFKVNNKIIPESYTIYPYIYGQSYFE